MRRGPYKTYVLDSSIPIPESTKRSRLAQQANSSRSVTRESTLSDSESDESFHNFDDTTDSHSHDTLQEVEVFDHDGTEFDPNSDAENSDDSTEFVKDLDSLQCSCSENDSSDIESDSSSVIDPLNSDEETTHTDDPGDKEWKPLYNQAKISKEEGELLILATALRHSLPDVGLNNMTNLIDCHLPEAAYRSKYHFLKCIPDADFQEYYYCSKCVYLLNFDEKDEATCDVCKFRWKRKKLKSDGHYFIYIPLGKQLKELIESDLYKYLRKQCDTTDIINGKVYKELRKKGIIGDNDLTLQWNVDGVKLFNSSKRSLYPILVAVNELPYRLRKNNIFLCGLWLDELKPPMNLYLSIFVDELIKLHKHGINCIPFGTKNEINVKVFTLLGIMDSVARPSVLNVKQYNGRSGCSYCLNEGKPITVGNGKARVYLGTKYTKRDPQQQLDWAREAVEGRVALMGVKGVSIVSLIPNTDLVNSYPPEYLHAVLLGIADTVTTAVFDSKNSEKEFYLGQHLKKFNEKLLSMQPPTELTRTPKPFPNKMNGNELKIFTVYYSISCFRDIMKPKYLKHWLLFVYGLTIFSKDKITDAEFASAKQALILFVKQTRKLYGKKFMRFNLHLLLHIPEFVEMYGALWAWSAFPYEGFNGVLKKLYHGTQHIPLQITKTYTRLRFLKNNWQVFTRNECSHTARKQFIDLMAQCNVKNCLEYGEDTRVFGKAQFQKLSFTENIVISNLLNETINENCAVYSRFIHKHVLFHTKSYKRLKKRCNNTVLTVDGTIFEITKIIEIYCPISESKHLIVLGNVMTILDESICVNKNFNASLYSYVAKETSNIVCFKVDSLKSKCVNIPFVDGKRCIIPIVNTQETD